MATTKLPSFLNSPKRDQCTGRIAKLAQALRAEGYEARHIAFAALLVADDMGREEDLTHYRRFLMFMEEHARDNLKKSHEILVEQQNADDGNLEFFKSL